MILRISQYKISKRNEMTFAEDMDANKIYGL